MDNKKRDLSLDLLRLMGIIIIMLAHANPPGWLFQLRNFGTPLLIITSALTHSIIYSKKKIEIKPFLTKRLKRLIIPAWIFLTFLYPALWLIAKWMNVDFPFTLKQIILSFFLYARFIWIFKVYFILALITPFVIRYKRKITDNRIYFLIICIVYILYELTFKFSQAYIPEALSAFMNRVVFAAIAYSLLYIYGFKLNTLSRKTIILITIISGIIFSYIAFQHIAATGHFVQTQKFKYPPRIYYLSFAFIAIHFLYLIRHQLKKLLNSNTIIWLSSKSLWIYLWHILACYIISFYLGTQGRNLIVSLIAFVFLLAFSVVLTYAQTFLVEKYLLNHKAIVVNKLAKYLL